MNIEQIKREVDQSMTEYRHYRDNRDMARSIVNKTIDYLVSRGYLGGVPDGYVLVPKEPTYEMNNAGKWAAFEYCDGDEDLEEYAADNDECALIYKAMIAAAKIAAAPNTFKKDENVKVLSEQVDAVKVCAQKGETK